MVFEHICAVLGAPEDNREEIPIADHTTSLRLISEEMYRTKQRDKIHSLKHFHIW